MNAFVLTGIVFFSLGILLVLLVILFSFLKYLQRNYYPKWTFLDYVSVGYFEHLYRKYIKRV